MIRCRTAGTLAVFGLVGACATLAAAQSASGGRRAVLLESPPISAGSTLDLNTTGIVTRYAATQGGSYLDESGASHNFALSQVR
jgi:hypothetical protein